MNFSPTEILTEIHQYLLAGQNAAHNRTLINALFNGEVPESPDDARAQNLRTNVNFLEATRTASNATNQIDNAFFKGNRYFTVRLDKGPAYKQAQWSEQISLYLNRELKRCRAYKCARESSHAQVVLHGPGPMVWQNRRGIVPIEAGLDDVMVPAGTLTSMRNLDRFAVYHEMTWSELMDASQGDVVDPGWNKPYVTAILATLYKTGLVPVYQGNRWLFPEKIAEDVKEGAARMGSSALPKLLTWDFFYRNEKSGKWNRRIILDYANIVATGLSESSEVAKNKGFLYEKDDYADDWQNILHWYIGNCSNVAPYRYHSIRSIGYLMYGISMIQNKLRCRLYDHMFQNLLVLFKNVSEDMREKLGLVDLHNFGVVPDGISMVTATERHQADWEMILMGLNQGRQLMAESASSFVPDFAAESSRPAMTATETLARQNAAVTLTSAVLNQLAEQSVYEYREICRRFCIKDNPDPMAKHFRDNIRKAGIPLEMLDVEAWEIIPEQSVGGGNKATELGVTQAMMQELHSLAGPVGQRIMERRRYLALSDNAQEAMAVFPDAPEPPSDDAQYAQSAYAVLMLGLPFQMKEGTNPVAYVAVLMQLAQINLQQAEAVLQEGPLGIPIAADRLGGLVNVIQQCQNVIQVIGQDKQRENVARQFEQQLGQLQGQIQNLAKQLQALEAEHQQQQAQGGGLDAESQAKIQAMMAQAQTKNQIDAQKASQKSEHKDLSWHQDNQRRNATAQAEIQRNLAKTKAEIMAKDILTKGELLRKQQEPEEANA